MFTRRQILLGVLGGGFAAVGAGLTASDTEAQSGAIFLTFDDGYIGLPGIVAALNDLGVRGTFFLTGQAIAGQRGTVRNLVASGHRLANHTYSHTNLTTLFYAGIVNQIQSWEQAAWSTVNYGITPYLRPPYFATNTFVRGVINQLGYTQMMTTYDTADWSGTSAGYIASLIRPGVVTMHTQGRNTISALYSAVPSLRASGYTFGVL